MTLEFAIIPITYDFISVAYDIKTKLKENVSLEMIINIDTNYKQSFNSRINKWKKEDLDIITIDLDYNETNCITVRFSDKGSRTQLMDIDEFIELVSSFEDENKHTTENDSDTDNDNVTERESGCIIM